MDFPSFQKRLEDAVGGDAKGIADRAGVSDGLLRKYIRGDSAPGIENLAAIAAAAGVSIDWLVDGVSRSDLSAGGDGVGTLASVGIPIISSVPAGPMQLYDVMEHPEETVPIDRESIARRGDRPFGLRIPRESDSMEPWMYGGDIVVCSTIETPELGDDVVLFQYSTCESTVKRLTTLNRQQGYVQLTPLNGRYDPFRVDLQEGDTLHKVLLVVRVAGRRRAPR